MPSDRPEYQQAWYVTALSGAKGQLLTAAPIAAVVGIVLLAIHLVVYGCLIAADTIHGVNPAACRANGPPNEPFSYDLARKCVNLNLHGIVHNLLVWPGLSLVVLAAIVATSGGALGCHLAGPQLDSRARARHRRALTAADAAARDKHYLLISVQVFDDESCKAGMVLIEFCDVNAAADLEHPTVESIYLPVSRVSWIKCDSAPGQVKFPASSGAEYGDEAILITPSRPEGIQDHADPPPLREIILAAPFNQ